jgi:hypothetical protein
MPHIGASRLVYPRIYSTDLNGLICIIGQKRDSSLQPILDACGE